MNVLFKLRVRVRYRFDHQPDDCAWVHVEVPIKTGTRSTIVLDDIDLKWDRDFQDFVNGYIEYVSLTRSVKARLYDGDLLFDDYSDGRRITVSANPIDCEVLWNAIIGHDRSLDDMFYTERNRSRLWGVPSSRQTPPSTAASDDEKIEEDLDEKDSCAVCLVRRKTYAFVPCGHYSYCRSCALRINRCVICRLSATGRQRIYR